MRKIKELIMKKLEDNKSSKLVIRNFTDVSDRKAEPGHGHSGIGHQNALNSTVYGS